MWLGDVYRSVSDWRRFLQIEGQATRRDAWLLLEAVGGLAVEWWPGVPPHLLVDGDRGVIILDPEMEDEEQTATLLEEVGHWLHRGNPLYTHSRRGYELSDGKAENPARAFRDLWLMAGVGLAGAEAAGVDPEVVKRYGDLILKVA